MIKYFKFYLILFISTGKYHLVNKVFGNIHLNVGISLEWMASILALTKTYYTTILGCPLLVDVSLVMLICNYNCD